MFTNYINDKTTEKVFKMNKKSFDNQNEQNGILVSTPTNLHLFMDPYRLKL
jgi:hypothetical protein